MNLLSRALPRLFRDTLALIVIGPAMVMFALNRDIPEALAVAIGMVILFYFKRDDDSEG